MNGMLKAGLIGLFAGAVFGLGMTLLVPYCTPCVAVVIGLGAGFLACLWDKPVESSTAAGLGAKAGVIAGAGHLLGQLLGMAANSLLVGPELAADTLRQFGLDAQALDATTYWVAQAVVNGGCGLTSVAVAAGLGALGGLLWHRTVGQAPGSPQPVP